MHFLNFKSSTDDQVSLHKLSIGFLATFVFWFFLHAYDAKGQAPQQACPTVVSEKNFTTAGSPGAVGWSGDGRLLAIADQMQRRVVIWNYSTQTQLRIISKTSLGTGPLIFLDDNRSLLTSTIDPRASNNRSSLSIINLETGALLRDIEGPVDNPNGSAANIARNFAVSPRTGFAATITSTGPSQYLNFYKIPEWSLVGSHRLVRQNAQSFFAGDMAFNPASGQLAIIGNTGDLQIWNPVEHEPSKAVSVFSSRSRTLAFSPDGRFLATGIGTGLSGDTIDPDPLRLWDTKTWLLVASAPGENFRSRSLSFSSTLPYLATLSLDGKVRLWDAQSLSLVCEVDDGGKGGVAIVFSPDGRRLAIVRDADVRVVRLGDK